jgi:hypothetical protein
MIAHGANIFTITGPPPPDSFGFGNQAVLIEGWSQAATYANVSITMPLQDNTAGGPIPSPGLEGTIYLMNQIGPGTTAANQMAPPVLITGLVAANPTFETRMPFSGLTLPAGNYYIVWVPAHTNPLSMSPQGGGSTMTVTPGLGVTALGGSSSLTPAPFPPATALTLNPPGNLWVTVTGDLIALPPPLQIPTLGMAGLGALLLGLAGAALLLLRRRRA